MPEVKDPANIAVKSDEPEKMLEGKVCVCFGDSLTASAESQYSYPSILASETKMEVIDLSISGTRLSGYPENDSETQSNYDAYNAFSFYNLANSICNDPDFSDQDDYKNDVVFDGSDTAYKADLMKTIAWESVDYITLCYGADDIKEYSKPLDNPENKLDPDTFLGALRSSVKMIQDKYPNIEIVIITPVYRQLKSADSGELELNSDELIVQGVPYTAWIDGMLEVAEESELFSINLYKLCGFDRTNVTKYYNYPDDVVHPNNKGMKLIGEIICEKMLDNFA